MVVRVIQFYNRFLEPKENPGTSPVSSVGTSVCLTSRMSAVRARHRAPDGPAIGRSTFEDWSNEVKQSPQDVNRSEQLFGRQLLEHKC